MYKTILNLNPGILIKYFNGIEDRIPMHSFGEEFTEVIRFKQSTDGKYVTIMGVRRGKLDDRFVDQKFANRTSHKGLFLYEIGTDTIKLEKAFLFAEKDPAHYDNIMAQRLKLPSIKKREYVEPEIPGIHFGEYQNDSPEYDGKYESYQDYDGYIDFKETDEVYLEELKKKKALEREEQKKKLEAEQKKLMRSATYR